MYVAAVSLLSSSPLSLIMAISCFFFFFPQSCLVCTEPQKRHCFFMPLTGGETEERSPSTLCSSFILLPRVWPPPLSPRFSLPPLSLAFPRRERHGGAQSQPVSTARTYTVVMHQRVSESSGKNGIEMSLFYCRNA